MQRIIITFILICSCSHLSATRNEKLSFTLDSLLDNISQIYKQKEASINTYKGIMDKDKSTATLLSVYDNVFVKEFVLYEGETLKYYFEETNQEKQFTSEKAVCSKTNIVYEEGKFGRLNLIARLSKEKQYEAMVGYKQEEQVAKELFPTY